MAELYGGYLKDIPKPWKRRFDDRRRRREVILDVTNYDPNPHYYTRLFEEDNPIWNSKTKAWQMAWDDKKGKGRTLSHRCLNEVNAMKWVRGTIRKVFSSKTHKMSRRASDRRWFYKEGD